MTQLSNAEWQARLAQAAKLPELGIECSIRGGTGEWPGVTDHVLCGPCSGSGSTVPTSTAAQ
jgi:hypothetical protein